MHADAGLPAASGRLNDGQSRTGEVLARPSGCCRFNISAASARSNQRASSSSARSTTISSLVARAVHPNHQATTDRARAASCNNSRPCSESRIPRRFTPDCILAGFRGFDEPSNTRPHAGWKLLLPPQQAFVVRGHQHDNDGVGARKNARPCSWGHSRFQPPSFIAVRVPQLAQ